jgi:hypothetical protein
MFLPDDPFPRIEITQVPYEAQKHHASQVDEWLGLDAERVESQLEREITDRQVIREQWVGLPVQSLLTPYTEIRFILEQLQSLQCIPTGSLVVDVGAAYGRMGMVIHRHFLGVEFLGLEICPHRVQQGHQVYQKLGVPIRWLRQQDVVSETVPAAQVYFIYDFGSPRSIQKILNDLRGVARTGPVVVVGRGRSTRDQIEKQHPWLSQIIEPIQGGHYTIYRTADYRTKESKTSE